MPEQSSSNPTAQPGIKPMGKELVFDGKGLLKLGGASSQFFKRQRIAAIKQLRAVVLGPGASKAKYH
ncbi:Hypothetical protein Minf_0296 [Methylacidiphilum infernorum V4]|uniref:Uncharacterized protein n=1 Tax=Methylacidiphilum infernorum (isolate V4) TaxID=481448 RepID=B3DY79_METI4|nr:Hypothetical protein Minf_0296 [Methylacidiphilum infernorum V4]